MALLCSIFSCFHTLFFCQSYFQLYFNTLFMPPWNTFYKKIRNKKFGRLGFRTLQFSLFTSSPSEIICIKKSNQEIRTFGISNIPGLRHPVFKNIYIFFFKYWTFDLSDNWCVFANLFFSPKLKDRAFRNLYILNWDT